MEMIRWHECCKSNAKRKNAVVRQVVDEFEYDDESESDGECQDSMNLRRVNGKRFVTEERLNQFGRELRDSIVDSIKSLVKSQNSSSESVVKGSTESRPQSSKTPQISRIGRKVLSAMLVKRLVI